MVRLKLNSAGVLMDIFTGFGRQVSLYVSATVKVKLDTKIRPDRLSPLENRIGKAVLATPKY